MMAARGGMLLLWLVLCVTLFFKIATAQDEKDPYFLKTDALKIMREVAERIIGGIEAEKDNQTASFAVPKKVFNDTSRYLFVAGIEGTGHHGIQSMMHHCFDMKLCRFRPFLDEVLFQHSFKDDKNRGLFGAEDNAEYNRLLDAYYQRVLYIQREWKHLPGLLNIIALDADHISGQMSYPNFDNPFTKSLDHPDLVPLAALTDAADADLRILVLFRSARDILHSTLRRQFGGAYEARILIENQIALYSQLQYLDPRFFYCVRLEDIETMDATQQLAFGKFLHPTLTAEHVKVMWRSFHSTSTDASASSHPLHQNDSSQPSHGVPSITAGPAQNLSVRDLRAADMPHGAPLPRRQLRGAPPPKPPTAEQLQTMLQKHAYNILRLEMELKRTWALCPNRHQHPQQSFA